MKRLLPMAMCLLMGCSSHPGADFLDRAFPGKVRLDAKVPPYGGVCIPQGAPLEASVAPVIPALPVPPMAPGPAVFPTAPVQGAVPPPTPPPPTPPPPR